MKKKMFFIIGVILICIIMIMIAILYTKNTIRNKSGILEENKDEIYVVSTMQDTIKENSIWCGTFQLVWNDMQDNLTNGKVEVDEPNEFIENLNKQKFKSDQLSEECYYKKMGLASEKLKEEMKNEIKEKFNEESSILDTIDWSEEYKKYVFYAMLKKEFEFSREFDILEPSNFKHIKNVHYFGINENAKLEVREQVEVLYYNGEKDFAVKLKTKTNDEVILAMKDRSTNFEDIYNNIIEKNNAYSKSKDFTYKDILKIPNLKIDVDRSFDEIINKEFLDKDDEKMIIKEAKQTIKMELDNKGGKILSESLVTATCSDESVSNEKPRKFIFDNDYVIFLKESDKDLPYFAACINDINLFVDEEVVEGE